MFCWISQTLNKVERLCRKRNQKLEKDHNVDIVRNTCLRVYCLPCQIFNIQQTCVFVVDQVTETSIFNAQT